MSLLGNKTFQPILGLIGALVLFFTSCQDSMNPSAGFNPGFDPTKTKYIEITIPIDLFRYDSVRTSVNQGRALVGSIKDDEFGSQKATVYSMMRRSSRIIPEDASYDSLTLNLSTIYGYGEVFDNPIRLGLHELTQTPDSTERPDRNFYTFDAVPYEANAIISRNLVIDQEDNTNAVDTTYSLRMPDGLGFSLFSYAQVELEELEALQQTEFSKDFPGYALVDEAGTTNGMLGFNLDNSGLLVHYHTATDTAFASYSFSYFNTADTSFFANFTGMVQDYSQSAYPALQDTMRFIRINGEGDSGDGYLKAGAGVYAVLKMDSLMQNYLDTLDDGNAILVNSAELLIPYDDTEVTDEQRVPNPILIYKVDEDYRSYTPNLLPLDSFDPTLENAGDNVVRMSPNENKTYYKTPLTRYMQALITERMEEKNKLMLVPFPFHDQLEGLKFFGDEVIIRMYYTVVE